MAFSDWGPGWNFCCSSEGGGAASQDADLQLSPRDRTRLERHSGSEELQQLPHWSEKTDFGYCTIVYCGGGLSQPRALLCRSW
mmetsp:Transcript_141022/g.256328  ORF Transcript_141022/g.256328 Transcript_141022/m.256328 type:complete len:83 (+) Transcript_141022:190-438(+)